MQRPGDALGRLEEERLLSKATKLSFSGLAARGLPHGLRRRCLPSFYFLKGSQLPPSTDNTKRGRTKKLSPLERLSPSWNSLRWATFPPCPGDLPERPEAVKSQSGGEENFFPFLCACFSKLLNLKMKRQADP